MGAIVRLADRLVNLMSGAGTTADKRTFARYAVSYLDQQQIEASYRGSWLMRKAIDLPPYDMTRAGRDWKAKADQIEKLEAEERRLQLWDKLRRGLVLGRLGGGALILGINQGRPEEPLDTTRIRAGDLKFAYLTSRWRLALGLPITDPASPWFGQPSYFEMTPEGQVPVRVHPSRVIAFRGQQVPDMQTTDWNTLFWGDPVAQSILDAIQNADAAQNGFATLIDEAKLDIIKMPDLMQNAATAEYEQRFMERLRLANMGKSTHRALVIDAAEEWNQRQINWAGMPDVIAAYVQIVAGAADIPATRLLGKSPDGMNATGEGDENNYRTMIAGRQAADLKPLIDQIDDVLIPSVLGTRDPNVSWEFAPLSVMSEADAADVALKKAQATQVYVNSGLVPTIALEKGVQNQLVEDGTYPGLDGALAELSDEERFPSLSAPDPNEPDPSAMQAGGAQQPKGGDPVSAGAGGSPAARRRAKDALVILRDAGLSTDALEEFRAIIDEEVGDTPSLPFDDAYDPNQPRDPRGRWTSGAAFVEAVLAGRTDHAAQHRLGTVPTHVQTRLDQLGITRRPVSVALDHSGVRHSMLRHGGDSRGQKPLAASDIALARQILSNAEINRGNPPVRNGSPMIFTRATIGSHTYDAVFEVRKYRIVLTSMRKR